MAGLPPSSKELRREVARRRGISNFRRLQLVCDGALLAPEMAMDASLRGPFFVYLRPYIDVDWRLLKAADCVDGVVRLLEQPLDPDAVLGGERFLHWAARNGCHEVVRSLLEAGAQKDAADVDWRTPLQVAVANGDNDHAFHFLPSGSDWGNHHEVVRCLLEAGADKDRADANWQTPLHFAAQAGRHDLVRSLVEAGADKDAANVDWRTPLQVAVANADNDHAWGLPSGSDWGSHHEVVRCLLEAGADKDRADASWQTPLHFAAEAGRHDLVRSLVEAGADKDAANVDWLTPLQVAVANADNDHAWGLPSGSDWGSHHEVVRCLLEAGADKDRADASWQTPLHFAAQAGWCDAQLSKADLLTFWFSHFDPFLVEVPKG